MFEKRHKINKFANYQNIIVRNSSGFDRHVFVSFQDRWSMDFDVMRMISTQIRWQHLCWSLCKLWEHRSFPPASSLVLNCCTSAWVVASEVRKTAGLPLPGDRQHALLVIKRQGFDISWFKLASSYHCYVKSHTCHNSSPISWPVSSYDPVIRVIQKRNRGGTWVNACWLCAAGLSEPLPHYSLFFGQL